MCELFAMSASQPTVVEYALHRFAAEGGEGHLNRDGWGIVFAEDRDAHVYREVEPAADSALARMVIERAIPCRHLIAHVRHASRGDLLLANTHPFTRVVAGRTQHFAHNGTLHDIDRLAPELRAQCVGDTDSELAFLLLLRELQGLSAGPEATEARFERFVRFAARMAQLGPANFMFFDGSTLFVHAHMRQYETPEGLSEPRAPGMSYRLMGGAHADAPWEGPGARIPKLPEHTVLLASVPLNEHGWIPLPQGCAVALRDGQLLHLSGTPG